MAFRTKICCFEWFYEQVVMGLKRTIVTKNALPASQQSHLLDQKFMQRIIFLAWITLGAALLAGPAQPQAFFVEPPVCAISPSGEWIAFSVKQNSKWTLFTRSNISGKGTKRDLNGSIDQLIFLNDSQLVYRQTLDDKQSLWALDITGAGNGTSLGFTPPNATVASIIENQPSPSDSGILYFRLRHEKGHLDGLFSLPVPKNGLVIAYDLVSVSQLALDNWLFDPRGKILGGVVHQGVNDALFLLTPTGQPGKNSWTTALTGNADDFPGFSGYGCAPGFLVASGYFEGNYSSAVLFDIATRKFGERVLAAKKGNIQSTTLSPDRNQIDGFSDWSMPNKIVPLNKHFLKVSAEISRIVGSENWSMLGWAQNYSGALVIQGNESSPPRYWHVDLIHKKGFLFYDLGQKLAAEKFHPLIDLNIRARDGLDLPCYQVGLKGADKSAPVIVWIGGGPFMGIHREWIPVFQCLASQGAVVVAMNYRGSKGFGKAFYQAGLSQANDRMVDDVEDVIGYLSESPDFRKRKVVVAGISFGGYLAVKALARQHARVDGLVMINPLIAPETIFQNALRHGAPEDLVTYQKTKWFGKASTGDTSAMDLATDSLMHPFDNPKPER